MAPIFVYNPPPMKNKKVKSHPMRSEWLTMMSPCAICNRTTWSMNNQVFKCHACAIFVHNSCLIKLNYHCPNVKKRSNFSISSFTTKLDDSSFDFSPKTYGGIFRWLIYYFYCFFYFSIYENLFIY